MGAVQDIHSTRDHLSQQIITDRTKGLTIQ
jgi:hypothetical protein